MMITLRETAFLPFPACPEVFTSSRVFSCVTRPRARRRRRSRSEEKPLAAQTVELRTRRFHIAQRQFYDHTNHCGVAIANTIFPQARPASQFLLRVAALHPRI